MRHFRNITFIISGFFSLSQINIGFIDIYYFYILIVVLFPILLLKYRTLDREILLVFSYILLIGIVNVSIQNNELSQLFKVFISTLVFYWLYYLIIKDEYFDLSYFYKIYYKSSLVVSYIGLFQFISYLVGFEYGYNYNWIGLRQIGVAEMAGSLVYPVHSVLGEPASFAIVLSPTIYMVLDRIKNKGNFLEIRKIDAYVIILAYLLTQSSTGYISFLFCLLLLNLNKLKIKSLLAAVIIIPGIIFIMYSASPKFQDRLDSSISLITGKIVLDAIKSGSEANGSSLVLFNHFVIAWKNAIYHPLGTGVGSHHVAFVRYNTLKTYFTGYGPSSMILNLNDACSLFIRILSEGGFIGIILVSVFIFKHFIRSGPPNLTLINHSALVMLFSNLLRGGHYFLFSFPFFVLCYYYSSKFTKLDIQKDDYQQIKT